MANETLSLKPPARLEAGVSPQNTETAPVIGMQLLFTVKKYPSSSHSEKASILHQIHIS